jgi:nitrate reductase gamma subunit
MTTVVILFVWLGLLVFAGGTLAAVLRHARAPMHLRWELYPVPHEAPERARHGGSRLEEPDWWRKPQRRNVAGELRAMLPEMFFLVALREHNRALWYRSFPFHLGLYLLAAAGALLLAGGAAAALGAGLLPETRDVIASASAWLAALGAALSLAGSLGLIHARLTQPKLRAYSAPADFLNLAAFAVAIPILAVGWWAKGTAMLDVAAGLLVFDTGMSIGWLLAAGLALAFALLAYIPFTHMSHFVAKWFTYHQVRWDDAEAGEKARAKMTEYLTYRPTWAASHVQADGQKTWADVASSNPAAGGRK